MRSDCSHCNQLNKKGIAQTDHRRLVFDIVANASRALSAREILQEAHHTSSMDRVTLYRILDLFSAKNLIRKIAAFNGAVCYEHVCEQHRPAHPHLVCRACGALECLESFDFKGIKQQYLKNRLAGYEDVDIKLEGICKRCAMKKTAQGGVRDQ